MHQYDYTLTDQELSLRLYNIIANQNHTVASIAREADMSDSTIRNLVDLRTSFNPSLNVLTKLSQALGFDVYHALFFKGNFLTYIQSREKKSSPHQEFLEQRLPKI